MKVCQVSYMFCFLVLSICVSCSALALYSPINLTYTDMQRIFAKLLAFDEMDDDQNFGIDPRRWVRKTRTNAYQLKLPLRS